MRVRQCAYFRIGSQDLTPDDITARLGIEPDRKKLRGSRQIDPPIPKVHSWEVRSGLAEDVRVDDHVEVLVLRLWDIADRLRGLIDGDRTFGVLQLVRYFDPDTPEHMEVARRGVPEGLDRLSGQHPLLGFHIDERTVAFLQHVNACIDVDEYGDDDD